MRRIMLTAVLVATVLTGCGPLHAQPSSSEAGTATAASGTGVGARIDRYLSAMEALGFSGAIVVEHRGRVALRKGYGLADRETRRPYTPETVQSHGSITKQMTAAAVLLLASRGALSVDDTIGKYFDDVPADRRGITLHQLLTHSSGMPGGVGPDEEYIGAQEYVARVMAEPLQFAPGTDYAYSNAGYALLGIIVAQVSGRGYEEFLREELLLPAGMRETGYVLPAWNEDRMAQGYRKGAHWGMVRGRGWREDGPGWHLRANGGLHTTVNDMHRWLRTLRGQGALDTSACRRWITGYVDEGGGDSHYAYGWVVWDSEWGRMIAHGGSNGIFTADFVWLPERDFFFYLHGNTTVIPAIEQRGRILSAAFDDGFMMPPLLQPDAEARPESARARAGTYRTEGGSLELTADDTRLVAKLWGQSVLDRMLQHDDAQRERFAALNRKTREAMRRLEAGEKAALAGIVREGEDAVAAAAPLLRRIERIGGLKALHVIGSFANAPGTRFAERGPWTTFVYAEFEHWNQYWNLVWNADGSYRENLSGPWPSYLLVPTGENRYTGVREGAPWNSIDIRFDGECLSAGTLRACADAEEEK